MVHPHYKYSRKWIENNRDKHNEYHRQYNKQYIQKAEVRESRRIYGIKWRQKNNPRIELVKALGSMCQKCGFSDIRALQIDHVDGGGNCELITMFDGSNVRMYTHYLNNLDMAKEKLQILCANCNVIKRIENYEYYSRYSYRSLDFLFV